MEGLFGQAKGQHGLDQTRLRGLAKMHVQGLLTAMVLNVKKLLQAVIRGSVIAKSVELEVLKDCSRYYYFVYLIFAIPTFALRNDRNIFLMLSKWENHTLATGPCAGMTDCVMSLSLNDLL
jgi:hypothetical protein